MANNFYQRRKILGLLAACKHVGNKSETGFHFNSGMRDGFATCVYKGKRGIEEEIGRLAVFTAKEIEHGRIFGKDVTSKVEYSKGKEKALRACLEIVSQ